MKAPIQLALAALAMAAAPLSAQVEFKLTGLYPSDPTIQVSIGGSSFSGYISPYRGAIAPLGGTAFGLPFDVFCVDETHHADINSSYDAWITPFTAASLAHTRLGNEADYEWAAYLASTMDPADWSNSNSTIATAAANHDIAIQDAIWALLNEGDNAQGGSTSRFGQFESSALGVSLGVCSSGTAGCTTPWTINSALPASFHASDWAVITCSDVRCGEQEFIAQIGSTLGGNVTPEPATLSLLGTGLAGVFGMNLRRRKKRLA